MFSSVVPWYKLAKLYINWMINQLVHELHMYKITCYDLNIFELKISSMIYSNYITCPAINSTLYGHTNWPNWILYQHFGNWQNDKGRKFPYVTNQKNFFYCCTLKEINTLIMSFIYQLCRNIEKAPCIMNRFWKGSKWLRGPIRPPYLYYYNSSTEMHSITSILSKN